MPVPRVALKQVELNPQTSGGIAHHMKNRKTFSLSVVTKHAADKCRSHASNRLDCSPTRRQWSHVTYLPIVTPSLMELMLMLVMMMTMGSVYNGFGADSLDPAHPLLVKYSARQRVNTLALFAPYRDAHLSRTTAIVCAWPRGILVRALDLPLSCPFCSAFNFRQAVHTCKHYKFGEIRNSVR